MKQKYIYLIAVFLMIASCAAFGRIVFNDFINQDDDVYITENSHVQSGIRVQNIKWAFTSVVSGNWHPVTLISHMADVSLFGLNPPGHHLVNLLFHIGSVLLLFLFLNKTTGTLWPSAFAAAFFAVHPLRVESVAWASERKDVLSVFLSMACIYVYAFYAEGKKISRYLICLILFIAGLMSKPMLVTMPFTLMLLDYWPLERWRKEKVQALIAEKTPFIVLAIVSCMITLWAQHKGKMVVPMEILPFSERIGNAVISYTAYLQKIFWPVNLSVFYPLEFPIPILKILTSGIILIAVTITVVYYLKKLPFLFVGWSWYLITLLPVIGIVKVGPQAIADRYTYLPSVGVSFILFWGIAHLIKNNNVSRKILFPAFIVFLSVLSFITWRQCGYWKNSIELFSHTLQVTKESSPVYDNLGRAFFAGGNDEKALYCFNRALRLTPDFTGIYNNRAAVYVKLGQYDRALADYDKAVSLEPDYQMAYYNKGIIYGRLGKYEDAVKNFSEAIRIQPDHAAYYSNRGLAYFLQGKNEHGCADVKKACAMGNCDMLEAAEGKKLCR